VYKIICLDHYAIPQEVQGFAGNTNLTFPTSNQLGFQKN